jgi:hypothetical protein
MSQDRRRIHWDGTITAGNVITAVSMLIALVVWGTRLEGRVEMERVERIRMEAELRARLDADSTRARDGFAELRAGLRRIEDILLRAVNPPQNQRP